MDAVFVVVIGRGRGGGGVPDPPDPNDDDGGGGPTTTPNGPAVVGGNVEVSSSLAMGGAMGGVMSCLCVRCWVSLIRWHNNICMVCFCIPPDPTPAPVLLWENERGNYYTTSKKMKEGRSFERRVHLGGVHPIAYAKFPGNCLVEIN